MVFSQKIRELAELRNWPISQVADKAGISSSTLYSVIERAGVLNVRAAIAVSRCMDVDIEWLFDDEKDWNDLPRRPFWLDPKVDPSIAAAALRDLREGLDQVVREKHGISGGRRKNARVRQSGTAQQAKASKKRRKRRA